MDRKKAKVRGIIAAICLIAAAFGYAPMWAAVFADVGVCLICVANASRLIRPKKG